MKRNWGLPSKETQRAVRSAKEVKPLMTLFVSMVFGIIGVSIAAMSFREARDVIVGLFHGGTLVTAVLAAGFGCWLYIWLARPRFAAQFTGEGDIFSSLLRFYARAAIALLIVLFAGVSATSFAPDLIAVTLLCASGGAAAAATFQTVLTFVPSYE